MNYFDSIVLSHQEKASKEKQGRIDKGHYIDLLKRNTKKSNNQFIRKLKEGTIPHLNFSTQMTTPLLTCIQVNNLDFLEQYYYHFNQLPNPRTPLENDQSSNPQISLDNDQFLRCTNQTNNDVILNILLNKYEMNETSQFYLNNLDKTQYYFTSEQLYPIYFNYDTSPDLFQFYQSTQKYSIQWDISDLLDGQTPSSPSGLNSLESMYINNFFDYLTPDNQDDMKTFFREQFAKQDSKPFLNLGLAQSIKLETMESIQDFYQFIQNHFDYNQPEERIQSKNKIQYFIVTLAKHYNNLNQGFYSLTLNQDIIDTHCSRVFQFIQDQQPNNILDQMVRKLPNYFQQEELDPNIYNRIHNILFKTQYSNNKNNSKNIL